MRRHPLFSALIVLLALACAGPAVAASSPYTVSLEVSAEGDDAVKAKEEALAQGMVEALRRVIDRISVSERAPAPNAAEADALVSSFSFESEAIGAKSYGARITVKFDEEGVRRFLAARGLRVVDQQAPTVLIVPVLVENRKPRLWEDAEAWASAIAAEDPDETLAPAVLPENTRSDEELDRDYLLSLAQLEITELRMRYRAHSVLLAIAEPKEDSVRLTLRGEDAAGLVQTSVDVQGSLSEAAETVVGTLQDRWKRTLGGLPVGQAQAPSRLRGALDMPGLAPPPVTLDAVRVRVLLRRGEQWDPIRRRLEESGGIAGLSVDYVERGLVEIRIWPRSGPAELAASLGRQGLDLFRAGDTWMLQAY